ncbi:MAG: sugar ABC transporter ATP-binding protein, partial [Lachnospiraceae bacterium]|nr:sugar ABC transporter ATP-binding protein [Lachnospiraceae bacterium]
SADLDEIVKLSDEIAVLYEGSIVARKPAADFTGRSIGAYMLGHTKDEEVQA